MNKKVFTFICVLLICSLLSFTINAQSAAVIDDADVFTQEQEQSLTQRIEDIRTEYDFDVTLLTTNDTGLQSLEDYLDFHPMIDAQRDGIIFGMDLNMREYFTIGRNYGQFVVSDVALSTIDDKVVPFLSDGDYYLAYDVYLDLTIDFLDAAESGESYSGPPIESTDLALAGIIGLIGGLIIAFSVTGVMIYRMNTARIKTHAADYVRQGSFTLSQNYDNFLYENTTRTARPKSNSNSGGRGGGGGSSSGGRGGGRF